MNALAHRKRRQINCLNQVGYHAYSAGYTTTLIMNSLSERCEMNYVLIEIIFVNHEYMSAV